MEQIKRIAALLYDRLERRRKKSSQWLYNTAVYEDLKTLYPMQNIAQRQREYVIEKLSLGMVVLLIGGSVGILGMIMEGGESMVEDNQLLRGSYGEGTYNVALIAESDSQKAQIVLELEERSFTNQELERGYEEFLPKFKTRVLGSNSSWEEVSYDLELADGIEGYPFKVTWQTDEEYVDAKGVLVWNELEEPVVVELTARITCQEFERQESFLCCIRSRASPLSMQEQLQKQIQKLEENNREEEAFMLPTEYGGKEIVWTQQKDKTGLLFLLATPLICLLLMFSKDKDLHKRVEEREEQMMMDYPELVSKLALLLTAGMTVPNAWQKIVKDYERKNLPEEKKRYAYEEMLLTANEWKSGVYQTEALESFGRRCKIPCYNKVATLLVQNLRSGSVNLAQLLQEEASEAFEERKHLARRLGEKAGTKLLFPMMLYLVIVMVIVIVPTFLSNMS